MKTAFPILLMAIAFSLLPSGAANAETVYVSDRLVVGVRELPDGTTPSIANLKSDDAVELLAEGDIFFQVKMADGTEGFIKKQYLTRQQPKALKIASLEKQLAREKKQLADIKAALSSSESDIQKNQIELNDTIKQLQQQLTEKEKQLIESSKKVDSLRRDLATAEKEFKSLQKDSGDVISIVNERESLKSESARLTDELNSLREENAYLLRTAVIKWFLAGSGVLLIGWMVGKSSRRKRRY